MAKLDAIIEELVTANRILAHEGIVDSFGHVSARHPERKDRFLLSRARAIYGFDYILLRPDLHVVWRGNRLPEQPAKLAAIATGHSA